MRSMLTNDNVRKEVNGLLEMFKEPSSLEMVAKSMFNRGIDIPSDEWSTLNRLIMMKHLSLDARGPKAWFKIGRKVKKAGHFCILAPKIIKVETDEKDPKTGEFIEETKCVGFYPIAVWPVENTEGKEVDYKCDKKLPDFLGKQIAESWGLKVVQGFENPTFYGYFLPERGEILIATDSQQTFFHELCHCADSKIGNKIKSGQDNDQEIVAEFSAAVLMKMFGLKSGTKNAYDYIRRYAEKSDRDPIDAVIPLVSRITKVVKFIMEENEKLQKK